MLPVTALYAGLTAALLAALALRVVQLRRRHRVGLGDGGHRDLGRAIRAHANLAEHGPMAILLLALAEGLAAPPVLLHGVGAAFFVGRIAHALALGQSAGATAGRTLGTAVTLTLLLVGGLILAAVASLTGPGPAPS